jgi:hypothetical protein
VGGYSNVSSGQYSVSGGNYNNATGNNSVALGSNNTASGQNTTAIGYNNSNNGTWSVAIGYQNTITQYNTVALGSYSYASQPGATALGYAVNSAVTYGLALVAYSRTYLYGQISIASGQFNAFSNAASIVGDAQQSLLTSRREASLTTAATTVLSLDGTGATNLIIPNGNNRAWNVQVNWVAVVTAITGTATGVTVGDTITQVQTLGFKKVGGISSLIGTANTLSTNSDVSMSSAVMTYGAGASQELSMTFRAPTFTGGGSITCRIVARVELTEVAW